jgi:cytosine/adenosine deaminase-related metal-dependent hydrolase
MARWWLVVVLGAAVLAPTSASAAPYPLVVNECSTGAGGWIELVNRGATTLDLARDPSRCWLVDDSEGGGAPKVITDSNLVHAAGSTTCSSRGRPATCGVVAPTERVWLKYAYFNAATGDQCRFLSAPRVSTGCGAPLADPDAGGSTSSTSSGQCFGRRPDGGSWSTVAMACTQGASNGACTAGAPCEDGNPCTVGEKFSENCACAGGVPKTGPSCGAAKVCQTGTCGPAPSSASASISRRGSAGFLLTGTIVTPDKVIEGEVLVVGDEIKCAATSCAADPAAATATVIETNGIVYPGLIDTHNHIQFDIFDETDWAPEATDNFTNHNQWPARARYKALVDAKQYLNGEGSPVKIGCELLKYGELKGLIAGTTSIVSAAIPSDQACFGSLARTIDQRANGLASDKVQTATPFPSQDTADRVCANIATGQTESYVIHIAEGVDDTAHKEFQKLFDVTTKKGCLFSPKTAIVHGAMLDEADFSKMATNSMSLIWSPRSNVFLYGHGTDLTKTANIPAAIERGITVALAPDWSIGGSQNLLDELRFADKVDNEQWGDAITPKGLSEMVTIRAARALGLQAVLGQIAPGFKADLTVIGGDRSHPYEALLASTPRSVRLVLVGGSVLYGDATLQGAAQLTPACETLDVCGTPKFACVAASGGTLANKLGQSYADIRQTIETELKKYDDKDLTAWDFSPIAPLYKCP